MSPNSCWRWRRTSGRWGAPGPEEAAGPAADEEEPVELGGEQQRGAQVDMGRDGEGHSEQRQACVPPVGPVQVGEEQHPAAEEAEQHQGPVHLVQQRVLLLILPRGWEGRAGQRAGAESGAAGRAPPPTDHASFPPVGPAPPPTSLPSSLRVAAAKLKAPAPASSLPQPIVAPRHDTSPVL